MGSEHTRAAKPRVAAIDWMRGIVMVLMAVDHASIFFNGGRVAEDSAAMYEVGSALPVAQFFTRFITHLCAPTFVFLAGTAIAISAARRRAAGLGEGTIDRDLLVRGTFIALLDVFVMSSVSGHLLLQVLYAIGVSMVAMVLLRRIDTRALVGVALALIAGSEIIAARIWDPSGTVPSIAAGLTFVPRLTESARILYPVLGWLPMMMLGWAFGERVVAHASTSADTRAWSPVRVLVTWGLASLVCFVVVRAANGYGNMLLPRTDATLVQWLHVSKYPPSLAFTSLELGLMALALAALMTLEPRVRVHDRHPLLVLGQTALFFYLAHFALLAATRAVLPEAGLLRTYLVAAAVVVALFPVCLGFRRLKRRYPTSVLRFI